MEESLDPSVRFLASRRHIANVRFVHDIEPWVDRGFTVRLDSGDEQRYSPIKRSA